MSEFPVNLIQVTDCHLQNDPACLYRGFDVEQQLDQVFARLKATQPDDALLMLTGDLVHHGGPAAYDRLVRKLADLPYCAVWIPGNHDDPALMLSVAEQAGRPQLNDRVIVLGDWSIVLLDSTADADGKGSGSLGEQQFLFLEKALAENEQRHCLVVLHHNPLSVESGWQDPIMLGDAEAFWKMIRRFTHVRGVICGHVHQQWDWIQDGVKVMATPSTSAQFKKRCDDMTIEDETSLMSPAYRLIQLDKSGEILSQVKHLPD